MSNWVNEGGWTVFRKGSGRGASKYVPYYNRLAVAVTKSQILLTPKSYEELGKPEAVQFLRNGDKIGFVKALPDNPDSYRVSVDEGGRMVSVSAILLMRESNLLSSDGKTRVYPAHMQGNILVVDPVSDRPSTV